MRTLRVVTRSAIAVIVLVVTLRGAFAQSAGSGLEAEPPWNRRNECISANVRDAPFSAEAVIVWHPTANSGRSELRSTARYYRDRAGRVRVDFVEGAIPQRVLIAPDVDSQEAYFLDTVARTASRLSRQELAMVVGGDCFVNAFVLPLSMHHLVAFLGDRIEPESLGERSIAGVRVTGTRFTMTLPSPVTGTAVGERWVSPELRLVLYSRREDVFVGIVEQQLDKISRMEPPAALFEVPAGYTEVTLPPRRWDNPYSPNTNPAGSGWQPN